MNPEELAELGITVHTIKGYGDIAVAEHTIALMWAAARGLASMDRAMRQRGVAAHRGRAVARQDPRAAGLWRHRNGGRAHCHGRRDAGHRLEPHETGGAQRHLRADGHAAGRKRRAVPASAAETTRPAASSTPSGSVACARARSWSTPPAALWWTRAPWSMPARRPHRPRGTRRVRRGAVAGRPPADGAGPGDAIGPQRLPHAGGKRYADSPRIGHRQANRFRLDPASARLAER